MRLNINILKLDYCFRFFFSFTGKEFKFQHLTYIADYYMALSHKDWELPNSRI